MINRAKNIWRGALVVAVLLSSTPVAARGCAENTLEIRNNGMQVQFSVELAKTAAEQAEGLMYRETMAPFAGMLFIYEQPRSVSFWMKNTILSLDMLFLDSTGTVQRIKANTTPQDTTPIPGGDNIQFVLEINAGTSAMLGITEGAEVRHPSISQENAAWPCE
ncbi:MAG: DUF192 domain-containing protein [Rhodobacteraceae bacterium]|nr:DUF192 domain-containing protein [Paracoccaceae bacterium]